MSRVEAHVRSCQAGSGPQLHNPPLLWTGPRRVVSLFLFHVLPAHRVADHNPATFILFIAVKHLAHSKTEFGGLAQLA